MNEQDIVMQWLEKAAEDLHSADVLFGVGIIANTCYHCQQAAEKALKAYLCMVGVEIPHTHNLSLLCKECLEHNADFSEIFRISSSLTKYATATRYPGDNLLNKEEAETAIQNAGRVLHFCANLIAPE